MISASTGVERDVDRRACADGAAVGRDGTFLSAVVPCYNEEDNLAELHRRLSAACEQLLQPFEMVLVNDGSTDATWPLMLRLAARDPRLVLVNLSRNFGKEAALTAGLELCRGERILLLDADLQDPPELLPRMLAMMEDGADVVYGRRKRRAGEPLTKRGPAALFYRLFELLAETPIPRDTGDFRLLSRRALDAVLRLPERRRFVRGLISWVGFTQVALEFDRAARHAGKTKWSLGKLCRLSLDALAAFSTRPLALASWAGGAAALAAAVLGVWFAAVWWKRGEANTLLGVLAGIAVASSAQLLALGVIGEYLGRLYEQSRGRPLFIVQDVVRHEAGEALDDVKTRIAK